jgi:hypothetical protein
MKLIELAIDRDEGLSNTSVRFRGLLRATVGAFLVGLIMVAAMREARAGQIGKMIAYALAFMDLGVFVFGLCGFLQLIFGSYWRKANELGDRIQGLAACLYGLVMLALFFGYISFAFAIGVALSLYFGVKII